MACVVGRRLLLASHAIDSVRKVPIVRWPPYGIGMAKFDGIQNSLLENLPLPFFTLYPIAKVSYTTLLVAFFQPLLAAVGSPD